MNIALYFGMYLLTEAVGGICYLESCPFDQSRRATAFGGGIAVWFFIASLLGMFGAEDMVDMGMGVEELGFFNRLTLVGLYDFQQWAAIMWTMPLFGSCAFLRGLRLLLMLWEIFIFRKRICRYKGFLKIVQLKCQPSKQNLFLVKQDMKMYHNLLSKE